MAVFDVNGHQHVAQRFKVYFLACHDTVEFCEIKAMCVCHLHQRRKEKSIEAKRSAVVWVFPVIDEADERVDAFVIQPPSIEQSQHAGLLEFVVLIANYQFEFAD